MGGPGRREGDRSGPCSRPLSARAERPRAAGTRKPETRITREDHRSLEAWAARWPFALPKWAVDWARESIHLAGGRYWCPPDGHQKGALVETPAPAKRSRSSRAIAGLAPLVHSEAFAWLARYQLGSSAATDRLCEEQRIRRRRSRRVLRPLRSEPRPTRVSSRSEDRSERAPRNIGPIMAAPSGP
jgi:hypothetical protein